MSKIICDICGTRYPETADQCPICGHIREASEQTAEDTLIQDIEPLESHEKVRGGRFSKANVQKRTGNAASYDVPPARSKASRASETARPRQHEEETFVEDKQNRKANTILNVLLVVVILALLLVTGYIFMKHILPQMNKPEPTAAPTETIPETTAPIETEEPTYPCDELLMESTEVLLTEYQQKWLINVKVMPENCTDKLTFTSENELIATVDSEGCITALAEGQTAIIVACGDVQVEYRVICLFPGVDIKPGETPTDPPPTEPPVEKTVTTNYVNIRSGPSATYDKVRQVHKGDKVLIYEEVTGEDGQPWGRLEDGWICTKYVK